VTFDELEAARENGTLDSLLQPVSSAVREWPEVRLTDNTAYYLKQGQPVIVPQAPSSGWVRLAEILDDETSRFLGVGEILDDGRVAPRRLVS
jgi:tRNA pseudouridine55 synthase